MQEATAKNGFGQICGRKGVKRTDLFILDSSVKEKSSSIETNIKKDEPVLEDATQMEGKFR